MYNRPVDFIYGIFDIFINLDTYLGAIIQNYGAWVYALLFLIIFVETGLVIMPLLPGDSLLFAAGAFASRGDLSLALLFALLTLAAILGDTVNYWIGSIVGPKIFREKNVRFLNKEHLQRTQNFYEKHGGKTIIVARFIPIIRTFAPFVAGIGKMRYGRFLAYNVIGGAVWVFIFSFGGYFFSNIPFVKENFSLVILGIIFVSLLPVIIKITGKKKP